MGHVNKIFLIFSLLILTSTARAIEGQYTLNIQKKQEEKQKKRWTIADWFDTKKQMASQDMWFAAHTKVVNYEFYIGGENATFDHTIIQGTTETVTSQEITRGSLAAYSTIFGFEGQYIDANNHQNGWDGTFNFRVFGNYLQNTNVTLFYGVRNRHDGSNTAIENFKNNIAGASITIYLAKKLGITGLYQEILKAKSDLETDLVGKNIEGTLFLDFGILRFQGTWFNEDLDLTLLSGTLVKKSSTGTLAGLKIFF